MEQEIWVKVKGYENSHEVSSFGRVKSIKRSVLIHNGKYRTVNERIMKLANRGRNGKYKSVQLKNKGKTHTIHRLVYDSFFGLISGLEINHIDGNPSNNRLDNLEQVTASENVLHAYRKLNRNPHKLGKFGSESKCNKHVCQYDLNYNLIKIFDCITTASKETNTTHISECAKGKRKTAGGYIWKYHI